MDDSNVRVHRNGDPSSPAFWEQFAPKDDEARKRFAKTLAEIALRKQQSNTGCAGSSSSQSAPNRRRKRR